MKKILNILVFIFFGFNATSQQLTETGLPYIQNYSPDDYNAFDQNWGSVQDSLGIMYFANGDGVLSYNGVSWDLIQLPNKASVLSIASKETGEIYVGAVGDFGYLETNKIGQLTYISLLPYLPKKLHDFSEIRTICPTKEGVFFTSKKYIFKWDGIKFSYWDNSGDSKMFAINNTILKRIKGKGLMEFKNDQFKLIQQGELFANKAIYSILPYNEKEFLIVTKNKLIVFNGKTYKDLKTNVPHFFEDNVILRSIALDNNSYAIGSYYKGLLIIDKTGQKLTILSQDNVLRSNCVFGLFKDKSGLIWISLNSGIAKVEFPSPFSFFNEHTNTPNKVFAFQKYQEKLFIGGIEGVFYLDNEKKSSSNLFVKVEGDYGGIWDMILFKDKMLIGGPLGVYEINNNEQPKKLIDLSAVKLNQSKIDTNRVFIGTESGLSSMYFKNGKWELEHKFKNTNTIIDKIVEEDNGNLWLELDLNELINIRFNSISDAQDLIKPKVRTFTPKDGLPDNIGKIFRIENQIYFSSNYKLYKFDSKSETFINDKILFNKLGLKNKKVKINYVDNQERIWLIEYDGEKRIDQVVASRQKNGDYKLDYLHEERIIDFRNNSFFQESKDSVVWYKAKQGIVRHDLKIKQNKNIERSNTLISSVTWQNDSLLFGGYLSSTVHQLPFKNNQLRFQYSSPSFYDESKNQFQYILDGFDETWSSWSIETQKDYTNIPEGDYNFKVRSKNIYNHIGKEDIYTFTILPPWYRSWWMYILYGLVLIGLILFISQWRSKALKRKNSVLENVINQRTQEIKHKNELLMHQTEKLVQVNDAKTQLYANITHEFRTPLTVILGMADTLKDNVKSNKFEGAEKSLEMIKRNGNNLLHLVNEMLDLAKSESGNMELQLVQADVVPLVKYLSESFNSLAEENQINLTVYSEIDALIMDFDINKLTSIISNLLSNAIKFTPEFGKIIVHINETIKKEKAYLFIKVKDNGIGISKEELPNIFNRFYQTDTATSKKNEGTGIGLALAKELVELMQGTIDVKSTIDKGSEFAVMIPVSRHAPISENIQITNATHASVTDALPILTQQKAESNTELPLVLIIEDNTDVAHYLKTCLANKYKTAHAIDGNVGIEMALEKIPDIIICDVMMPEKNGFEVCKTLKSDERTNHIPIIMLTAKVTLQDRLKGLKQGADAYLAKPFNKDELFTRLEQLVQLRQKLISKIEKAGFKTLLKKPTKNPKVQFLQKVVKLIHEDIENSTFGSADLAEKLLISDSQIYRKIKAITGKSTAVFIRSIRLQYAKELLKNTDKTVSEVAYAVGFNDPSWFSRAFKEEFGYTPSTINK